MPIEFRCPSCNKLLRTPDESSGKKAKCPHCNAVTQVPRQRDGPEGGEPKMPPFYTPPTSASGDSGEVALGDLPRPTRPPPRQASSDPPAESSTGGGAPPTSSFTSKPTSPFQSQPTSAFAEQSANPYSSPSAVDETPYWNGPPHRGGIVFTLGLIGLICSVPNCLCYCFLPLVFPGLALCIPAWIMGRNDLRSMDDGQMDPSGQGMTRAGVIMGIVGVSLCLLAMVCWVIFFGIAIIADVSNA